MTAVNNQQPLRGVKISRQGQSPPMTRFPLCQHVNRMVPVNGMVSVLHDPRIVHIKLCHDCIAMHSSSLVLWGPQRGRKLLKLTYEDVVIAQSLSYGKTHINIATPFTTYVDFLQRHHIRIYSPQFINNAFQPVSSFDVPLEKSDRRPP